MTRHCNSCVWPSFAGHQSGHVPATRDLAKTVRSSKKWVKQVKQLNSQTISNLSWRGLRSAVEGKVMHIKKSTTTRNILCCFVRHSVPQAQAMKIRSDFEGHWWAFENDEPPGCEAKQGMGYPFILLASTLSPNLFNNLRVAGAWRRGRILQGASWILQKHRVNAIRWQQKSSILLEDKKGKGNGKDLSKSGRLLERSMLESLNFSLIVCCVLFLMNLLQSRIHSKIFKRVWWFSSLLFERQAVKPLTASDLQMGCGGKVANVAYVAVFGALRFHIPMHGMIFVAPGLHLTERRCQKDKQDEEIDRNTAFECDFGFCFVCRKFKV